jgi:hypothetical protein
MALSCDVVTAFDWAASNKLLIKNVANGKVIWVLYGKLFRD